MKFRTKLVAGLGTYSFSFEWVRFDVGGDPSKDEQVGTAWKKVGGMCREGSDYNLGW